MDYEDRASVTTVPTSTTFNARQQATVCTDADLVVSPDLPAPDTRQLEKGGDYWFGGVHLEPAPAATPPEVVRFDNLWSERSSLGAFMDSHYASAIYDAFLAYWTSDGVEMDGAPHDHVLAWVVLGKHVPVAASDASADVTVPGRPCYFGSSIAAADATTGDPIAISYDSHPE